MLQFKHKLTPSGPLYKDFSILKLKDMQVYNICNLIRNYIHHPLNVPNAMQSLIIQNNQYINVIQETNLTFMLNAYTPQLTEKENFRTWVGNTGTI